MRLHVTHETRYEYSPPVETAQHLAHLRPLVTPSQRLLSHRLAIEPAPAQRVEQADLYGNVRAFFALDTTHDSLVVTAESVVETSAPVLSSVVARELPWESVRERFRFRKDALFDPASEFVFHSPYVPRHDDFVAYARASFAPGRPAFDVAMDLTERIHRDFDYDADSTEINTPAAEALAQRKGVCQDFAQIMISGLRAAGLPAAYASGYLRTLQPPGQPRLVGADATHAWVLLWCGPVRGWVGVDPTNGIWMASDHIVMAVGRDYAEIAPVDGVVLGSGAQNMDVSVDVAPLESA